MSTQDNGGPAFPVPAQRIEGVRFDLREEGMTLRDYFAAKAMQAVLGAATAAGEANEPDDAATIARAAYFMADAMLKARQQ